MEPDMPKTWPPFAPFPEAAWRGHLLPDEWSACLDDWITLTEAHLLFSVSDIAKILLKDETLATFLSTFVRELARVSPDIPSLGDPERIRRLRKDSFLLTCRLMDIEPPPDALLKWEFLLDLSKAYGKTHSNKIITGAWTHFPSKIEAALITLKTTLIKELDAGIKGRPEILEKKLARLNHLLHASPETAAFFMSGADFLDGLISCYRVMNPPLRKAIIATAYLCLIGLTEGSKPNFSLLRDQLYSLKSAAEAHKAGPTNVNDSMVAELITGTPILKQIQERIDSKGTNPGMAKQVLASLEGFRKPGGSQRPKRLVRRKIDKGKGKATAGAEDYGHDTAGQIHVHRMSLISQVQDLFPDLGSGFIVKLLDEYNDNVEEVISHLLEGSLPSYLENSDRSEQLTPSRTSSEPHYPHLSPRPTPPLLPTRHNIYDNDNFDNLAISASKLHLGRRNPDKTADDILQDKSNAPAKAAILSALAAFDSDDDERDDTYDIADVGGTVDSATPGNNPEEQLRDADSNIRAPHDEALFRAFKMSPDIFDRDAATRRGKGRQSLKEETGMTDEAIEGWAVMLGRDPQKMRRLEARFSAFAGGQTQLASTSWRPESGDDEDGDGGMRGRGGFRGRGGRGGGRGRGAGGRGRGNVAGPTGERETEVARQRKEANKGSRANHNRRDQRARKMARGGFPG